MRVLVIGAHGFIGSQIAAELRRRGHEVIAGVRTVREVGDIVCDLSQDIGEPDWSACLKNIDAVVNCAGILRETTKQTFVHVHYEAPRALTEACLKAGTSKLIQISALGHPDDSDFIRSKYRFDEYLQKQNLAWVILRPSVVYSPFGSYGGTSLIRALAAWPYLLFLPGDGRQELQPINAEDLAVAVALAIETDCADRQILEAVGPERISFSDFLLVLRRWLGIAPPLAVVPVPLFLIKPWALLGEWFGRGPLGLTMYRMLQRGNIGRLGAYERFSRTFGVNASTVAAVFRRTPSFVQDRWHARLYLIQPLLKVLIGLLWIASGLIGLLTPIEVGRALIQETGLAVSWTAPLVYFGRFAAVATLCAHCGEFNDHLVGCLYGLSRYYDADAVAGAVRFFDQEYSIISSAVGDDGHGGSPMMDTYLVVEIIHILSAAILFGTGIGSAYYMWLGYGSGHPQHVALVSKHVVWADWWFTTPTVIIQPVTGFYLLHLSGQSVTQTWIVASLVLYVIAGLCWLPVVWLQIEVRDIAREVVNAGGDFPPEYHRYMYVWFALGWIAFLSVIAIFWLMVLRPN
jgi:uncharacterized membrane protein/uncharacterized protein YbjT (DUF2867 family)